MSDPVVESLILDLLEWISNRTERTCEEVMDAWRTSCPGFYRPPVPLSPR